MTDEEVIRRVREAAQPDPGPALRARVLSAAVPRVRPAVTLADRMWFSLAWRLAAVATVIGLVALELGRAPGIERAVDAQATAVAAERSTEEAAIEIGMPAEAARAFGRRARAEAVGQLSTTGGAGAGAMLPGPEGETP